MSTATAPSSSAPRTSTPPPSAPRTSTPSGSAPSSGPSGGAATPATGGAQAAASVTPVRDSAEISPTARAEAGAIDPDSPADLTDQIGSLDYYRMRADDFRERNPDMEPPDYYMNYGDKYARRTFPSAANSGWSMLEPTCKRRWRPEEPKTPPPSQNLNAILKLSDVSPTTLTPEPTGTQVLPNYVPATSFRFP